MTITASGTTQAIPFPDDAVKILSMDGEEVTIRYQQTFKGDTSCNDTISWVRFYLDDADSGEKTCEKKEEVCFGAEWEVTAKCINDMASITLYMHDGTYAQSDASNPDESICDGWMDHGNDGGNTKVSEWTIEIACNVACGVKSTDGPEVGATAGPTTVAPTTLTPTTLAPTTIAPTTVTPTTSSPTTSAPTTTSPTTNAPTLESVSETSDLTGCDELGEVEIMYEDIYMNWPSDAGLQIMWMDLEEDLVSFKFTQTFKGEHGDCEEDSISWVSLVYTDETSTEVCQKAEKVCFGDEIIATAKCDEGIGMANVTVYVHDGSFNLSDSTNPGVCDGWPDIEEGPNSKVAKYEFTVPCGSECDLSRPPSEESIMMPTAPTERSDDPITDCPEDVVLISQVGTTDYPDIPITILEQNTYSVKFRVQNTFDVKNIIFTQFHESTLGQTECFQGESVETLNEDIVYTAYCMKNVPISIVDIWFTSDYLDLDLDNAEVPECCHPSKSAKNPTVQYTFKVYCEPKCVPAAAPEDRMLSEPVEMYAPMTAPQLMPEVERDPPKFYKGSSKAFPPTGGHYCSKNDFPCGENDENVYVCHYSSRDGYQTFCAPEPDSDILGFYPKDYCGPCVGGYGHGGTEHSGYGRSLSF
jgi:hypothetical protein